jgi:hypothetical protein
MDHDIVVVRWDVIRLIVLTMTPKGLVARPLHSRFLILVF